MFSYLHYYSIISIILYIYVLRYSFCLSISLTFWTVSTNRGLDYPSLSRFLARRLIEPQVHSAMFHNHLSYQLNGRISQKDKGQSKCRQCIWGSYPLRQHQSLSNLRIRCCLLSSQSENPTYLRTERDTTRRHTYNTQTTQNISNWKPNIQTLK